MLHLTLALGTSVTMGGLPVVPHHHSPKRVSHHPTSCWPRALSTKELQSDNAIIEVKEVPEEELLGNDVRAMIAKDKAERACATLWVNLHTKDKYHEICRH